MYVYRSFYKLKEALRHLKWRCQRFSRGYADIDCWDIDEWFTKSILKILKQFKSNLHGHPFDMTEEEWEAVLQEMIDCFELVDQSDDIIYLEPAEQMKLNEKVIAAKNKGLDLFKEHFFDLWD